MTSIKHRCYERETTHNSGAVTLYNRGKASRGHGHRCLQFVWTPRCWHTISKMWEAKSPYISSACSSSIRKEFYDARAAKQFLQRSVLYPQLASLQVLPLSKVRQKDTQEVWGWQSATKRGHEIFSFGAFKLISDYIQLWPVYFVGRT